jgi:hypothetical protein
MITAAQTELDDVAWKPQVGMVQNHKAVQM